MVATIYCGFCGKAHHEAKKVIVGGACHVAICDECVGLCVVILTERQSPRAMLYGDIGIPAERAQEWLR